MGLGPGQQGDLAADERGQSRDHEAGDDESADDDEDPFNGGRALLRRLQDRADASANVLEH